MTRTRAAVLGTALVLTACVQVRVQSGDPSPASARAVAQALLDHGAAAWNRGDLAGFMSDYADDATFVASQGLVRGRDAIHARYAPRFAPGGIRDSLWFGDVEARFVADDAIQAVAWWHLSRGDSLVARGPTSLLLRRTDGRWRIVHDHSS